MLWLSRSARADCQAFHLFFRACTIFSLKSLLCQGTCAEISCLSVVAPDLHQWKSEEHHSTRALFSWPAWKRVNPNQHTSLAGEAMQYLILQVALFLLFSAVCACREDFFPRLLFDFMFCRAQSVCQPLLFSYCFSKWLQPLSFAISEERHNCIIVLSECIFSYM